MDSSSRFRGDKFTPAKTGAGITLTSNRLLLTAIDIRAFFGTTAAKTVSYTSVVILIFRILRAKSQVFFKNFS